MTVKALERRLDRLRPSRIVLLARMPDGTEQEMSAPEYVEAVKSGVDMIRVLRGNNLRDVDLILSTIPSVIDWGMANNDQTANQKDMKIPQAVVLQRLRDFSMCFVDKKDTLESVLKPRYCVQSAQMVK